MALKHQSAAIYQHLRSAEQVGSVWALKHPLDLSDCAGRQGFRRPSQRGQFAARVPGRRLAVGQLKRVGAESSVSGVRDYQHMKSQRARAPGIVDALICNLHKRDVSAVEQLSEDGGRASNASRSFTKARAKLLRVGQPIFSKSWRLSDEAITAAIEIAVNCLFNRDVRHEEISPQGHEEHKETQSICVFNVFFVPLR